MAHYLLILLIITFFPFQAYSIEVRATFGTNPKIETEEVSCCPTPHTTDSQADYFEFCQAVRQAFEMSQRHHPIISIEAFAKGKSLGLVTEDNFDKMIMELEDRTNAPVWLFIKFK